MSDISWHSSAEDFGQKVDLTVRIREILRNYPEGLSILKELIQNADDAGARTVRFCIAEARSQSQNNNNNNNNKNENTDINDTNSAISSITDDSTDSNADDPLSNLMKGPSLLAYNSGKFSDTDFKSIQQIGDSLKKDAEGTKTGRFGVGVNSTYHLTDVPMFVSGSKVVMFDPQATFVPGINPANPGKMVDCSNPNGRKLVQSLPHVFDPLKVFGCELNGEDYNGTIFRFALRTVEQSKVSRLSRQYHLLDDMKDLLTKLAKVAPSMLLFLKNVECIEIYEWKASETTPTRIHRTALVNDKKLDIVRKKRAFVLNAQSRVPKKAIPVDYVLEIESEGIGVVKRASSDSKTDDNDEKSDDNDDNNNHNEVAVKSSEGKEQEQEEEDEGGAHVLEKWIVCNQLGGGRASIMANDPSLSHMRLVPWAGVAARISPCKNVFSGLAYCFLPLPVQTNLPIHVNGYFELSSNRRDVWSGNDMAGDGKARAEWNDSLVHSIAAPCYIRLISAAINAQQVTGESYEQLFPQVTNLTGPWEILIRQFFIGIRNLPILYSECSTSKWVTPAKSLLLHDDSDQYKKLAEILSMDRLPLVQLKSKGLKTALLHYQTCTYTTTPNTIRQYYRQRQTPQDGYIGSLENTDHKIEYAQYLLLFCTSDLKKGHHGQSYDQLAGCQFIPLANGELGRFCTLPQYNESSLYQLQTMGFSKLESLKALRIITIQRRNRGGSVNDVDAAMEWLLRNKYKEQNEGGDVVQYGIDPYLVCSAESSKLLMTNAAETFINLDSIDDPTLKKFFSSSSMFSNLNILQLQPDMLADVVSRAVPRKWRRGTDSAVWKWKKDLDNRIDNIDAAITTTKAKGSSSMMNGGCNSSSSNYHHKEPDLQWFMDLWRYICAACNNNNDDDSNAAGVDMLKLVAEQYCIVPTHQGIVTTLSPGASVIDVSGISIEENDKDNENNKNKKQVVIDAMVSLGVRVLYKEAFPKDMIIPNEIWTYIFPSTSDGVVKAIDAAQRRQKQQEQAHGASNGDTKTTMIRSASDDAKNALLQYFAHNQSTSCPLSTSCKHLLRSFPIFNAYCNPYSLDTQFVSMCSSSKTWYVLEDDAAKSATNEDRMLMTRDFLATTTSTTTDQDKQQHCEKMNSLFIDLGAKTMSRAKFFTVIVSPQLIATDQTIRNKLVQQILVDLPSLSVNNPKFSNLLSQTKCIPSAKTQTLKSPIELYDPEVTQLVSLMDVDSFPDAFFSTNPELLLSLRKLGLRSTLTWSAVLECARQIEAEASGEGGDFSSSSSLKKKIENSDDDKDHSATINMARTRGAELLMFLDLNVDTFFPEFSEGEKSKNSSTNMYFFQKVNQALFQSQESELEKEKQKQEQALRIHELLRIKWVPIHAKPPHPFLPWPEYELETVAAPLDCTSLDKMWLASYGKRLVDGDVHSIHLKKLFTWLDDIPVKQVALQLRMLSQAFEVIKTTQCTTTLVGEENCMHDSTSESTINIKERFSINALCQKISSEVGRIYHILNNSADSIDSEDVMKSVLHGCAWLWMGDHFVSSDHIAYSSSINATPYLFTVPPDLACFRNLLSCFNVRDTFGSSDYCMVLNRMATELVSNEKMAKGEGKGKSTLINTLTSKQIELAVNLVQKISDDVLRLEDMEVFAPTKDGKIFVASRLVYDDAPWLSKDLPGKKELIYAHPKLSASVCERIGVKSVRKILLQNTADMISFGDSLHGEAFGQSESLTRRLKNIVEMYPEGPQQLNELIQNADDAQATLVRFIVSKKQYGKSSLLGQKMTEWQGDALYCYNDAVFTPRDFQNLSKIGQASKLQKLVTTGRFGLGFNSVFHWTDVPSIVSGDNLVMFDPHAKYVPGATEISRGIKIRFSNTELVKQFPHQMEPYLKFGCDMKSHFHGTLFRFPFRNDTTAAEGEISKKQYGKDNAIEELLVNFKKSISKVVLFLRHVKRVEVYFEDESDESPNLLYYAEVTDRKAVISEAAAPPEQQQALTPLSVNSLDSIRNLATSAFGSSTLPTSQIANDLNAIASYVSGSGSTFGSSSSPTTQNSNDWNAIASYVAGSTSQPMSKEAFYVKLLRTPENQLPQTRHIVTINFVEIPNSQKPEDDSIASKTAMSEEIGKSVISDKYLICSALGAGECRAMACNPEHRDLKFLPWASVAAHLTRNGGYVPDARGNAFCFLPLPAETGFSVHINGYFELSANRRDIWYGDDMTGAGQIRSEWNSLLLSDVISPLYCQVLSTARKLLGSGRQYDRLWPVDVSSDIWKVVRSRVYQLAENMPLVYSLLGGGKWVTLRNAVFLSALDNETDEAINQVQATTAKTIMAILLQENISVVSMSPDVISCMRDESCEISQVNPSMVREWFKRRHEHPSLCERENVVFLLRYCIDDLVEGRRFNKLHGLPLLPLFNGSIGCITEPKPEASFFIANEVESNLLEKASNSLVDVWTSDSRLNGHLLSQDFHSSTNVQKLNTANFVKLLSHSYPPEWLGLPEVRWVSNASSTQSSPENPTWLSNLWKYMTSFDDNGVVLVQFEDSWPIIPTLVGEGERTLQVLTKSMAVVNMTNPHNGDEMNDDVSKILHSIGIRTLDTSIFKSEDRSRIFRKLEAYIQPPTVRGIIKAMSIISDGISYEERNERMAARFGYLDNADKAKLRVFLLDCEDIELQANEITTLRSLPIFEVFALGKQETFANLTDDCYLPPACADQNHLDHRFVKAISRKDVAFLERLGLTTMPPLDYYMLYLSDSLAQSQIDPGQTSVAVTKLLQDIPALVEGKGGKEMITKLSNKAFVPNANGQMVKPTELYDPHETGLIDLVDSAMLPSTKLRQAITLQSLRSLGMRTQLSCDGVLESARRIEYEAKNLSVQDDVNEDKVQAIRKRAVSLLNFLDDDSTIAAFLSDDDVKSSSSESIGSDSSEEDENKLIDELASICWLPVERDCKETRTIEPRPPRKQHQLSKIGISSPTATRPKSDEWICSNAMDILSVSIKCETLINLFKWNESPGIIPVASQIVALANLSNAYPNSQSLRQNLAKVTSQIYEILNAQIEVSPIDKKEKVLMLFYDNPWIWVGDCFIRTAQVAFDAPDNAKPFLYSVPNAMECFSTLLKSCGVRESFSGEDFVKLLSSLSNQLGGNPCDSKQLDLAIFVSRYLSRVPPDELMSLDKSRIFLPSREGAMHKASRMTFDDAPWLSAIVKKTRHVFVHPDVGNEVARVLGSKSLRDVLSADQNGMVKVPCPTHEALRQLLGKRKTNTSEICRVVSEIMEIAEIKGAKQVSVMLDRRVHGTMSLLHPCLAAAQGAAIVVCFHDTPMEVDEVVKLTSPSKYYSSGVSRENGCGGKGFPRFGRGFCGSFLLTDCLQILTGRSFIVFDPNGNYFIEDQVQEYTENKLGCEGNNDENQSPKRGAGREKANARNYGMSYSFYKQFPDQFDPFLSLSAGVEESMINGKSAKGGPFYRGTIVRVPLRTKDGPDSLICNTSFDDNDIEKLSLHLKNMIPKSLIFTYHLQSVSFEVWPHGDLVPQSMLNCRVSSSPLSRRNHVEKIWNNKAWKKDKSKLGSIFKRSWSPVKSSYILRISSRQLGEEADILDTYLIMSVLAPPRLQEMACTESLAPIKLLPVVTMAAHLQTLGSSSLGTSEYKAVDGLIFVGLPTGMKTGLPFHINAPFFLHEWSGTVLLQHDADADLKRTFPSIRNVTIVDKHNMMKTVSLALYVWNRQLMTSSISELMPSIIKETKDAIQQNERMDPRLFYKFWPFYSRVRPHYKDLIGRKLYDELSSDDMEIYLTENDGFKTITEGCFASPDYPLNEAADFFLRRTSIFTTPKRVIEDLSRFGIGGKQLTPSVARSLLRGGRHLQELTGQPSKVLAILEYCLADILKEKDFKVTSYAAAICRKELLGLHILPLADGSIGKVGRQIVVASAEQQSMLPKARNKFLLHHAVKLFEPFLSSQDFMSMCSFEKFGPKTLSRHISTVLPASWEGMDFVQWNPESGEEDASVCSGPGKVWIYQFWREVPIWSHDAVQMFRRWPLIPTTTGELASCGNARFILYICNDSISEENRSTLLQSYETVKYQLETDEKRDLIQLATEQRLQKEPTNSARNRNEDFLEMGHEDDSSSIDSEEDNGNRNENEDEKKESLNESNIESDPNKVSRVLENLTPSFDEGENAIESQDGSEVVSSEFLPLEDSNASQSESTTVVTANASLPYYPTSESFRSLYKILSSVKMPFLNASFFRDEDASKVTPPDRLSVTRAVMSTLNQCINYWHISTNSVDNSRIRWTEMTADDFDELLLLLSTHQGSRLSLMISDLSMMKSLPLFETFTGTHIPISDRDENFTIDNSVDMSRVGAYLPHSLQSKLLLDKPKFKDLYKDLNIQTLDETSILHKFILKEFVTMTISQKEAVIKNILEKWDILCQSDELVNILKETPFVKRREHEDGGEVVFVKPNQLFDPRNELLSVVFDKDSNYFPAEEFATEESLDILKIVGLKTNVDKETFLKCAKMVEGEESISKALTLFEYFNEHFGEFYDSNQGEFIRNLAEIQCVPAVEGQSMVLCRFRDSAAPKDKHLTFKVMPIIHSTAVPPQVMFSSLGVISPPRVSVVLRQLRALTEDESGLDHWTYKHGTVEQVFSEVFSFLQDNFSELGPRVQDGLRQRPIVPVGTTLVRSSRLFFRLAKDLAPFFYEVPRAFGAYDFLLRELGVRDSPKSGDYALSLSELNREIGASKLNANELKSVIEVVNLAAADDQNHMGEAIFAPDLSGKLISVKELLQNDCPWLVNSKRLDINRIHLAHPKLSKKMCDRLQIRRMSQKVHEIIDEGFEVKEIPQSDDSRRLDKMLQCKIFGDTIRSLMPNISARCDSLGEINKLHILQVESIKTRFVLLENGNHLAIDVTNRLNGESPCCFIDGERILLAKPHVGISIELAIATALSDKYHIPRQHIAGIAAVLSSDISSISEVQKRLGLYEDKFYNELRRGEAGQPLVSTDLELVEIKPLKAFKKGEIVAVKESTGSSELIYGVVMRCEEGSSLSRLSIAVANNVENTYLSSEIYSLGRSKLEDSETVPAEKLDLSRLQSDIISPTVEENEDFESVVAQGELKSEMVPINREEVLSAVQDLLQSADLSLNHDGKKMLDSNLALQEELSAKNSQIEIMEKKADKMAKHAIAGIDSFLCPITREPMEDPVICCDGHTYERHAIQMWLRSSSRSPKTNQLLASKALIPNHALRNSIEAMKQFRESIGGMGE